MHALLPLRSTGQVLEADCTGHWYASCTTAMCYAGAPTITHGDGSDPDADSPTAEADASWTTKRDGDLTCTDPKILIAGKGDELPVYEDSAPLNEPCYADDSCIGYPTCCVKFGTCVSVHGGSVSSIARNYEGGCYSDKSRKGALNTAAGCTTVGECAVHFLEVVQGAKTKNAEEMMNEIPDATLARLKAKDTCGCPSGDVWNEATQKCDCDPWWIDSSCYRNCAPEPTRCANFDGKYPPSSPPPPLAMTVALTIAGDVASITEDEQAAVCGKIATAAGVAAEAVTCAFAAGGERRRLADTVVITAAIVIPGGTAAEMQNVADTLADKMGTTAKASAVLGHDVTVAPVMSTPAGETVTPEPLPDDGLSTGVLIAIIVGSVCGVILFAGVAYLLCCKKAKKVEGGGKGASA